MFFVMSPSTLITEFEVEKQRPEEDWGMRGSLAMTSCSRVARVTLIEKSDGNSYLLGMAIDHLLVVSGWWRFAGPGVTSPLMTSLLRS